MKLDRLRTELEKAKQRAAEWQARVKDIENRVTEQENTEIIQAVRSISASPEELKKILGMIRSMNRLPGDEENVKEETERNEGQ